MAKVIAVANQKGGCSKTSVAGNLGIGLVREGKKVCLIDADPPGKPDSEPRISRLIPMEYA